MDISKAKFSFQGETHDGKQPPIKIAFLGTRHPHVMYRFAVLDKIGGFEFSGFYEEEDEIATGIAKRLPRLPRFNSAEELLNTNPDVVMIHSLDPDVPRWARFSIDHPAPFKGLFLEKPGAADPVDFYKLAEEIETKRPGLAVELGYEMHYSEALDFARKVIREGVLGDITTARFHGGCPSGAGMDLWQSIPEDLGGIMQTEGCHTLENVIDMFGAPERVVSSIRKLPERPPHPVVGWIPDLFTGTVSTGKFGVGTLLYEDVCSGIMEYPDKTIVLDMTAWEPTEWCNEWAIDVYGTNGSLHAVPDYPVATLYLREARGSFAAGETKLSTELPHGTSNVPSCYRRQFKSLFTRVRGEQPEDGCCDLQTNVQILKVIDAFYKSASSKQWIDV
ncbi:putative oxidoreductase [Talaromyces proteolyticus]|uniref:Oxidoreductase n=1 Tax=Talaromyces proteolyticus TaxID=1131652 RepID=A0AAD4PUD3_9EURO|nr:putative oxidoreductase [Talaromyces proteolyticus]KAH8689178.1 putative oxidoreductase [Talaromyces proteolyticus]